MQIVIRSDFFRVRIFFMHLRNNMPCSQFLILCIKNLTVKFLLFIRLSAFAFLRNRRIINMIKQTRGAIRFLLADYRAVLKYAMIAAAGIALASPSFAKITINGNEGQQTTYSDDKDFGDSVVVNTKLTLEDGDYTADSVDVTDGSYGEGIKYELVVRNATLTTSKNGGRPNPGSGVLDPIFVQGKLSLTDATVTSRDNGEPAYVQLWGSGAEAAFAGKVKIDGDLGIGIGKDQGTLDIVMDGKDTNGTYTGLNLKVNGAIDIDRASLTLKGYDKAVTGTDDTFTKVTARETCVSLGGRLTVGHNASMEVQGLYIKNVDGIGVKPGTVTVTDGGKLLVTGNGYNGNENDQFFAAGNFAEDGDTASSDQTTKDLKGIIKAANSSEIVFSHKAAVLYDPVTIHCDYP